MRKLKNIDDLEKNELYSLVFELFRDGADVQGMETKEFAELGYGITWED